MARPLWATIHTSPSTAPVCLARGQRSNLASDVDGLRLVLETTMRERYHVKVRDDGAVVELWKRWRCHRSVSLSANCSVILSASPVLLRSS